MKAAVIVTCLVTVGVGSCSSPTEPVARTIEQFEQRLESLRRQSRIPAISVAIADDQRIAWSK